MTRRRIATFLNIRSGEERLVSLLILFYFTLAMGFVFVQSMAFGVFIAEYGPQGLPYSYIAIAIFASLAAALYIKLGERVSFQTALMINVAFLGLLSLVIWLGLKTPLSHSFAFTLPLLFQIVANMGNLAVWSLAVRLFDFQQGKRLFPLLGIGLWTANTIGGLLVTPLVAWMGSINLLVLAVISITLSLFVLRMILNEYLPKTASASEPQARKTAPSHKRKQASGLLQSRYVREIFAYIFLWWMAFVFLDNIFYDRAAARFTDADQLTAFTGQLLSIIGFVALISSTYLNSRIIKRFGLRVALAAMPLVVTFAVGILAFSGSMAAALAVTFSVATFAKVINVAYGFSLSQSANAIVYQSLPDNLRSRVQATAEGVVQPVALGIGGLSLLALTSGLNLDFTGLSYAFLFLGAAWVATIFILSGNYVNALTQVITRRRFGVAPDIPAEPAAVALLRDHLHDPHPGAAIYALVKLEELDPGSVVGELPALIQHPASEVRREAYARIEKLQPRGSLPAVRSQLEIEPVPEVKESALRALGAIADDDAVLVLTAVLYEPDPHTLRGALVGLLKYGTNSSAEHRLNELLVSPSAGERVLAAQVLGELNQERFLSAHKILLGDPHPAVRREALRSAGKSDQPSLVPLIIAACDVDATSRLAGQALASMPVDVLPQIESALAAPDTPRLRSITLANALGDIGGTAAQKLLLAMEITQDSELRAHVLDGLSQSGYRVTDASEINAGVNTEISEVAWVCAAQAELGDTDATHLLYAALEGAFAKARDRVLLLISFAFDPHSIQQVRQAYLTGSAGHRSYALEIIDTILPSELRQAVLPILEDIPPLERTQRLASLQPPQLAGSEARLHRLIGETRFTSWMRACAIYTAVQVNASSSLDAIKSLSTDPDLLISETARWASNRLETNSPKGNNAMFTTIEKVIILKTVNIFSQTPDDVLADVANLLDEVDVVENETVINKGDPGDSMYVIVDGKMSVHDNGRILDYLGDRDVFGEMALLDTEPRTASVTALEPTRLFRLDQAPFYELIADRPEIATGIIRVLMGYLRNRMLENAQLASRMRELETSSYTE